MRSMTLALVVVASLHFGHCPHLATAQTLSPEQEQLLAELHAGNAAQCLEVVERVIHWRERLTAAAQQLQQAQAGQPVSLAEFETVLKEVATAMQPLPPAAQVFVGDVQQVHALLQQADARWQNAPWDPDKHPELTEAAFREQSKREVYAAVGNQVAQAAEQQLFAKLQQLRDPAGYLNNALQGELQKFAAEPRDLGGGLRAKLILPEGNVAIFSPQANLGVEIEYMPQQLSVKAAGLYFAYQPGGVPRPVTDNLTVDPSENLQGRIMKGINSLGTEITAEMNLPLTVTIAALPEFGGAKPGGLRFSLEVGLMGDGQVKAKADDLILYPGNKVDWGKGILTIDYPQKTPVLIPPAPLFAFWTLAGDFKPETKAIGFKTKISTAATPPDMVSLNVHVQTQMPIKDIGISGALVLLGSSTPLELGTVEGKIDFTKGVIEGSFVGGNPGGLPLSLGDGNFELRSERMMLNCRLQMLGATISKAEAAIQFTDGSAEIAIQDGLRLFGADFASTWKGSVAPGFKSLKFEAVQSIEVPGIQPYGSIHATVIVRVDTARGENVEVEVKTFMPGLNFKETVPSLAACTPDKLHGWLQGRAVAAYHQFLNDMAKAEKNKREWLAKHWERMRKDLPEFTAKTGNDELDALGAELSREFKNVGGAVDDVVKDISGGLQGLRGGMQDGGKALEEKWGKLTGRRG